MSKKNNMKCIVCGKEYRYCNTCDKTKPSWMMSFCSDNCRRIYNVASAYNAKKIKDEEALAEVKQLNISRIEQFTNTTKRIINEILSLDKKEEKAMSVQSEKQEQDVVVTPKKQTTNRIFKKNSD